MAEKMGKGHRQRLRERFRAGDYEWRSGELLLELLLTFAIGRKDVRPLAEELIKTFGGVAQVLAASCEDLQKVDGLGQASITLLKAIDFTISVVAGTTRSPIIPEVGEGGTQSNFLVNIPDDKASCLSSPHSSGEIIFEQDSFQSPSRHPEKDTDLSMNNAANEVSASQSNPSLFSNDGVLAKKSAQRKLQVSNGYYLEFDQLARILHFLLEHQSAKKIARKDLQEDTGLADQQVKSLVSMGSAMGLIIPGRQVLTPVGLLVAERDLFFERTGTLEWCHYMGASSYRNLIWFEVFNHLLAESPTKTQEELNERLRHDLSGKYTKRTMGKGVYEEVRFVIDAYMKRNFSKLELLHRSPDEKLYLRRYTSFARLVLSAMIYDFGAARKTQLLQISEIVVTPGSPALLFGLDATSFRQQIEGLHEHGWLRYETTHNLDQVRLKPGFSALAFLTAHFELREPRQDAEASPGGLFK